MKYLSANTKTSQQELTPATSIVGTRLLRTAKWALRIAGAYAVIRLTVVIGVPAWYLNDQWVDSIRMKCLERQDLCVQARVQDAVVAKTWWGKAFYFTSRPGKAAELKAFVVREMPDKKSERILTPWNYVGAEFTDRVE